MSVAPLPNSRAPSGKPSAPTARFVSQGTGSGWWLLLDVVAAVRVRRLPRLLVESQTVVVCDHAFRYPGRLDAGLHQARFGEHALGVHFEASDHPPGELSSGQLYAAVSALEGGAVFAEQATDGIIEVPAGPALFARTPPLWSGL